MVRDRQRTCRQLAWILRRPWAASLTLGICRVMPGIAERVIRSTNDPSNHLPASKNRHNMSFCISGIGTAVPSELITQDDAAGWPWSWLAKANLMVRRFRRCIAKRESASVIARSLPLRPTDNRRLKHSFLSRAIPATVVLRPAIECVGTNRRRSIWPPSGSGCAERKPYGARGVAHLVTFPARGLAPRASILV